MTKMTNQELKAKHEELINRWKQWFDVVHPNGFNPPFVEMKKRQVVL